MSEIRRRSMFGFEVIQQWCERGPIAANINSSGIDWDHKRSMGVLRYVPHLFDKLGVHGSKVGSHLLNILKGQHLKKGFGFHWIVVDVIFVHDMPEQLNLQHRKTMSPSTGLNLKRTWHGLYIVLTMSSISVTCEFLELSSTSTFG